MIIVKIGGNAISKLNSDFFEQLRQWRQAGKKVLLIHGGGPQISKLSAQLNVPTHKENGIRVTDQETLALTKMVLLGNTQPALLLRLAQEGLAAIGLNASDQQLLTGTYVDQAAYGAVGSITGVNELALSKILNGQVGVLAPLALTRDGKWLNVNADTAAADVARLLKASQLYLLTDVPGVLKDGKVISAMIPQDLPQLIEDKVITDGMQPKLSAAVRAVHAGVQAVRITDQLTHPGTTLKMEAND
nr:acetylglutamate kinase [Secundilactobacillus angelensis]